MTRELCIRWHTLFHSLAHVVALAALYDDIEPVEVIINTMAADAPLQAAMQTIDTSMIEAATNIEKQRTDLLWLWRSIDSRIGMAFHDEEYQMALMRDIVSFHRTAEAIFAHRLNNVP